MEHFTSRNGSVERTDNGFTAKASDLGLPVGTWPMQITIPEVGTFNRYNFVTLGGSITSVLYVGESFLTVWNG